MTQTVLTNSLSIIAIVGVAVLQHFGLVDQTVATIVYAAIPAYAAGSGTLKVTPGAPVVTTQTKPNPLKPSNGTNGVNG